MESVVLSAGNTRFHGHTPWTGSRRSRMGERARALAWTWVVVVLLASLLQRDKARKLELGLAWRSDWLGAGEC